MSFSLDRNGLKERRISPGRALPATGGTPMCNRRSRSAGSGGGSRSEGAPALCFERVAARLVRRRRAPALEMAHGDAGERCQPFVLVVEAGHVAELLAARGDKRCARLLIDFLEGLEAVACEAGAEDVDVRDPGARERD